MKIGALVILFLGEALAIFAEMRGAKAYTTSPDFYSAFLQGFLPFILGGVLLVTGYMLGLKYFQNIWVVTALSIGSILLLEPAFNYFYLGQLPTTGSGIGFVLGVVGILCALFIK